MKTEQGMRQVQVQKFGIGYDGMAIQNKFRAIGRFFFWSLEEISESEWKWQKPMENHRNGMEMETEMETETETETETEMEMETDSSYENFMSYLR